MFEVLKLEYINVTKKINMFLKIKIFISQSKSVEDKLETRLKKTTFMCTTALF